MTINHINGVNLSHSKETQERIRTDGNGSIAKPEYQSIIEWKNGYHTVSQVTDGQIVVGDEPIQYGGSGTGLTPQDLLLTATGHCLAVTYVGGLSAAGIKVESLRLHVSGKVNFRVAYGVDDGNPGFEQINIAVDIKTDAPHSKVDAVLKQLLKTAPIPDTIMRPVPVAVQVNYQLSNQDTASN